VERNHGSALDFSPIATTLRVSMSDEKNFVTIDIQAANTELEILLDKYDWFYCSIIEGNSICVYVNHADREIMSLVPDRFYGHHIKIGFSAYLTSGEKYGKNAVSSDILDMLAEMK